MMIDQTSKNRIVYMRSFRSGKIGFYFSPEDGLGSKPAVEHEKAAEAGAHINSDTYRECRAGIQSILIIGTVNSKAEAIGACKMLSEFEASRGANVIRVNH